MPMIELPKYASVDINTTALKIEVRCTCRADFDQVIKFLSNARELFSEAAELLPEPKAPELHLRRRDVPTAEDIERHNSDFLAVLPRAGRLLLETTEYEAAVEAYPFSGRPMPLDIGEVVRQVTARYPAGFPNGDLRTAAYLAEWMGQSVEAPPIFDPENASSEVGGIPPTIGPETAIEAPYEDPF